MLNKRIWVNGCLSALLIVGTSQAATDNSLRNKGFSDPAQKMQMPETWQKQPLQHADWAKDADIAIIVDQQFYPLILPGIQEFAKQANLKIVTQEGTCGTANKGLSDKTIDIGGFCCPPSQTDRFPGIKFHTVGIEAIPVLVNASNPISDLTVAQVRDIFQGKVFRWSDLKLNSPAPARIIQSVGRLHCKQRPGHWRLLLDNEDLFSPRLLNVGTIKDMLSQIATNPDAIGFEELLWTLKQSDAQGQVKALAINGIAPTNLEKLAQGAYPFYNVLNLTTWEAEGLSHPKTEALVAHVRDYLEHSNPQYGVVGVARLRAAGWQFVADELVGEPQ